MRNCLYMGDATRFLKAEASTDLFLKATGRSLKTKTMRDREFINRFCAFQLLPLAEYRGDMDDFLARGLKKMNALKHEDLQTLSSQFRTSLVNNYKVFGEHAFRKHTEVHSRRSVLNASLWDVMSTGLSRRAEHVVEARAETLRRTFYLLLADDAFVTSITYGPNDMRKVKHRFAAANGMFAEVFDAN